MYRKIQKGKKDTVWIQFMFVDVILCIQYGLLCFQILI